jgi:DUF438 domain-containing protein
MAANRVIAQLANQLGVLGRTLGTGENVDEGLAGALRLLTELAGVENHYQRKEHQLFPLLERHGVTGPSQVMWGVHDQIRTELRSARNAVEQTWKENGDYWIGGTRVRYRPSYGRADRGTDESCRSKN